MADSESAPETEYAPTQLALVMGGIGAENLVRPFTRSAVSSAADADPNAENDSALQTSTNLNDVSDFLQFQPSGMPPSADIRQQVEARTGKSLQFSRIHQGPAVDRMADEHGTPGMTIGPHVLLKRGSSDDVLRHELVHAAQNQDRLPDLHKPLVMGARGTAEEREAQDTGKFHSTINPVKAPNVVRRYEPSPPDEVEAVAPKSCTQCHTGTVSEFTQPMQMQLPVPRQQPPACSQCHQTTAVQPYDSLEEAVHRKLNERLDSVSKRNEGQIWTQLQNKEQRSQAELTRMNVEARLTQQCPKAMCHSGRENIINTELFLLRYGYWKELVDKQNVSARQAQATSLEQDIERGEFSVLSNQVTALNKVQDRLPANLNERWMQARHAIELLRPALQSSSVSAEIQEEVRPRINSFYWGMLQLQEKRDAEAATLNKIYSDLEAAQQQREAELWQSCPKMMCHAGTRESLLGPRFYSHHTPIPPYSPTLYAYLKTVDSATSVKQWRQVLTDFADASKQLDNIVVGMLPKEAPERQAMEFSKGLLERQQNLQQRHPEAVKIPAVFYPQNEFSFGEGNEQIGKQIFARGLPWFFYLYRIGSTWVLEDLTTGKKVNKEVPSLYWNVYDYAMAMQGKKVVDPPPDLFAQLNSKIRFPKGLLYLTLPSGKTHIEEMTQPWEWSEILSVIGISLAVLGFVLLTAGYGTGAGIAFGAAAISGALGTYSGLQEKELHGMATDKDRRNAAILIAADIASVLSLGLGKFATSAAAVVRFGRAVSIARRLWAPVTLASGLLDGTGIYVMTEEFVVQFRALEAQPGLSKAQKDSARQRLILSAMITGGLALISLRSTVKDLKRGLPLEIEATPEGFRARSDSPAVRTAGADVSIREQPATPETGLRYKAPKPELRGLDETLGAGDIVITMRRSDNGLVQSIEVSHGPKPRDRARLTRWERDLTLHQEIAVKLQSYGGLQGKIRQLFQKIREILGGAPRKPLALEFEVYKLQKKIQWRMQMLQGRGGRRLKNARVRKHIEDEINNYKTQLDKYQKLIDAPDARELLLSNQIAGRGNPEGFPPAVGNHVYYQRVDGKWDLALEKPGPGQKHFRVEYDSGNKPTGRLTNSQQLADSGLIGQPYNEVTKKQLRDLGYVPKTNDVIQRPPEHSGGSGRPFMEPLTVRSVTENGRQIKRIEISTRESFAESQARIKESLNTTQKNKLAGFERRASDPGNVVVLRGVFDTGTTWADVLRVGGRDQRLLAGLIERGVEPKKAKELVDALVNKQDTIKVVLGTAPLRRFPYAKHAGPVPPGQPVHHFDPLYLGGKHTLLTALPKDVHDWVHRFFDDLTLPSTSKLPNARLEPNSLQAAVPKWKPGAADLKPDGEVSYEIF